jgi:hypothetical protein
LNNEPANNVGQALQMNSSMKDVGILPDEDGWRVESSNS